MDIGRVGRSIRALRLRRNLRQRDVAALVGCSQQLISKIERGGGRTATLAELEEIANALGADLDVLVRWRGEGLDRLLDEAHSTLVESLVNLLRGAGWRPQVEVSFNVYGERGSIDVLGTWPSEPGPLLVSEVKSVVPDNQATLVGLDRKARLAPRIMGARADVPVGRLLVLPAVSSARSRIDRFGAIYDAALPDRGVAVRRWLRQPTGPMAGILFIPWTTGGGAIKPVTGRQRVRLARPPG